MINLLLVALGGAVGASLRYLFGMIPFKGMGVFPLSTLLINLLGSFLIGFVVSLSGRAFGERTTLFLKTGFCGGFTTFSTFSLENMTLIQNGNFGTAALYMGLSFVLCVAGCAAGFSVGKVFSR